MNLRLFSGVWIGTLSLLLALVGCMAFPQQQASDASPTEQDREHQHKRRGELETQAPPAWDLISPPMLRLKGGSAKIGVDLDMNAAFVGQWANKVDQGKQELATFSYEVVGEWQLLASEKYGDGFLDWTILGSQGLNYSVRDESLSLNTDTVSGVNTTVEEDPAIVDELFWHHHFDGGKTALMAGKINLSSYFDTNRVANSGYRQFLSSSLENNSSIPFPTYGGFGGILLTELSERLYLMVGMGDSSSFKPVAPSMAFMSGTRQWM